MSCFKTFSCIAVIAGAVAMTGGAANAQTEYQQDNGLSQDLEARAMVRLHMPFGKYASERKSGSPKLSLNLGIDQRADWRSPRAYQSYDNVLELGLNFDGERYLDFGGVAYSDIGHDQLGISGDGAVGLWLLGGLVLTAGGVAGIVLAVDNTVEEIQELAE